MTSLLRRVGVAAALLWLVVTLTFLLVHLAPGDPATLLLPPSASAAEAARLRERLGLDAPLLVQYARWLGGLLQGDLGTSLALDRPVRTVLGDALPITLLLGGASLAVTFVVGVAVGTLQAARRGRVEDYALTGLATFVYAAPSYWLSLAAVAVFTYGAARWHFPMWLRLPAFGVRDPGGQLAGSAAFVDLVRHAVLPVLVLSAVGAAGIARYARSAVVDVLAGDYVRTARAKGASTGRRLWSSRAGERTATTRRAARALVPRHRRGLGVRRVRVRMAWDGTRDGASDRVARLSRRSGRDDAVRRARHRCEPRGRRRPAVARSTPTLNGRRVVLVTCAVALAGMVALAIVVPMVSRSDPLAITDVLATRLLAPGATDVHGRFHLVGTDRFGRDVLLRMLVAARLSLAVGVAGSVLAGLGGTLVGAFAGWRGGAIDLSLMAVADAMLAVPRLVLLLVIAALWGPGTMTTVVVLVATGWMGVARLVRAEVLGSKARDWVDAARALGASDRRVLWRHVVPNAIGPAIVATTLGIGNAILLESGLSFLGLGIQPPAPSWGNMIAGGRDLIVTAPWIAVAPGLALVLTVLACTLLGDALRDRLTGS